MKKLEGEEILKKWRQNRLNSRFPLVAVLDNIRSAYNVGSMFRTAECAYLSKLILCGITAYPPNSKLEKTALGTTKTMPWEYFGDTYQAVKHLKNLGYKIAALEITDSSLPIQKIGLSDFPLALVIGNEVTGVDERVLEEADMILEIPLYGEKESLNVAIAFGVAIFLLIEKLRKTC
ncbi:RNA methyltransferase [Thermodesulfobacterium sp. TA1]|uniref:RNA methyltransferase n=1 Tax=Thermodesulfobacterium sp. TA1 TaxID=2234087 RepID=UPI001232C7AA|nr:RNA methyltransferase [Thermodesulfobacterium sp. TA1]QER42145.1 RNA methyltransferase [Thermodesulfobacterium sp. TA1]